ELQGECVVSIPPGEPGMAGFAVCYAGPPAAAEAALAPLRRLGRPVVDDVAPMPYTALQRSGDIQDPRAIAMYVKSGFINEVPPGLVEALTSGFTGAPGRTTALLFQQSGGAIADVAPDA